jgi:hypothetical protein
MFGLFCFIVLVYLFMFAAQLKDNFKVLRLKSAPRAFSLKLSSTMLRNSRPICVATVRSKGGLYQVIFIFLVLFFFLPSFSRDHQDD